MASTLFLLTVHKAFASRWGDGGKWGGAGCSSEKPPLRFKKSAFNLRSDLFHSRGQVILIYCMFTPLLCGHDKTNACLLVQTKADENTLGILFSFSQTKQNPVFLLHANDSS